MKRLAITKDDILIKRDSIFVYESGVSFISASTNVTDSYREIRKTLRHYKWLAKNKKGRSVERPFFKLQKFR